MNVIDTIRSFQETAPVNVEGLILALGVDLVKKAELHPDIAGEIAAVEKGKYRIAANKSDHYYRRRFTMAHELGHYLLHRDLLEEGTDDNRAYRSVDVGNFFNSKITPTHETEANRFAANLLMPKRLVEEKYNEVHGDTAALSRMFQVSEEAMRYRLQSLNLNPNP